MTSVLNVGDHLQVSHEGGPIFDSFTPPNDPALKLTSDNGKAVMWLSPVGPVVLRTDTQEAMWRALAPLGDQIVMQGDGNLVVYKVGAVAAANASWASGTDGSGASHAIMQGDGNFVLYKPGGDVPADAVWASGTNVRWPRVWVKGQKFAIDGTGYQQSKAEMFPDGTVLVKTHTWSAKDLVGFHASVVVGAFDETNQLVWPTTPLKETYGVDGTWIGTSDRTDTWAACTVPADVRDKVRSLRVFSYYDPHNVILGDLGAIGAWIGQEVGDVFNAVVKWLKEHEITVELEGTCELEQPGGYDGGVE